MGIRAEGGGGMCGGDIEEKGPREVVIEGDATDENGREGGGKRGHGK